MSSKSFHPHLQNEFLVKKNWLVLGWFRLAAVTSSLARASVWRFSEVSGSLLHAVVKYTLHRLFEQNFYRIISELFSSGSVLCLLTLIFQRVSLHIENGQMKGITVML